MTDRTPSSDLDKHQRDRRQRAATSATAKLRNLYRTGDETGLEPVDEGESFSGLLPIRRPRP